MTFRKLKILAISYMMPPLQFPQSIQIGRLLLNSKHEICVVTSVCEADSDTSENISRIVISDSYPWLPLLHNFLLRFMPLYGGIPDQYVGWSRKCYEYLSNSDVISKYNPDIIVTFGEPMSDHLLGLKLAKRINKPWIAHFSDPWSENPFRRTIKLSKTINRFLEKKVANQASAFIFTSPETMNEFKKRHNLKDRMQLHVLPHSYDPQKYTFKEIKNERKIIRYLGNFYGNRSPLPLIKSINYLRKINPKILENIFFEFVGNVSLVQKIFINIIGYDKSSIRFINSVSYARSLDLMVESNALLVIDAPAKTSQFFPSKLIEYLGAGRPIIALSPPGPSSRLVEELGGLCVDPSDLPGIINLIRNISQIENLEDLKGLEYSNVREEYAIKNISAKFDAILSKLSVDP